jgi:CHAT domain
MAETRSALIIASEASGDPGLPPLPNLVVLAQALADVFEDPGAGDFDVRLVIDQPAEAIRARMAEFFAGRRTGDLLVVYYAGYVIRDAYGELYLAAADTVPDRPEETAVPAGFVSRQIGIGGSRNVVLLLDCAEYGEFPPGLAAKGDGGPGIERDFRGQGRTVIAGSGGAGSASWRPTFSTVLFEGLRSGAADGNGDGQVGLDELYDYVAARMREIPGARVPGLATGLAEPPDITRGGFLDSYGAPRRGRPPARLPDLSLPPPSRNAEPPESVTDWPTRGGHLGFDLLNPLSGGGSRQGAAAALFWNTRFPRDLGILLNRPHLVVAGTEYRLETGLGPKQEPGAITRPQPAERLRGRQIRYRLEAENGEFRLPDSARWQVKAESAAMTCTAAGTDAFAVHYRARQAGPATIRALLIVDNGSVDQQDIELRAVASDGEVAAAPLAGADGLQARPVGRSVEGAPSPDYRFSIRKSFADLWHQNTQVDDVELPAELASQLDRVARDVYAVLREVSRDHPLQGGPGGPLRVADPAQARLRLAKAGAALHYRLFREPLQPVPGGLPAGLGAMADYLRDRGTGAEPALLQIVARDYPLPWGLLYDRSGDGGRDLRTPDDVDPAGFWGRRFDIYRSVVSVDRDIRRGRRRWVKPVIGAEVPRNAEQRDFVDELRADLSDALLRVDATISTVPDLRDWATSGRDSDLVYLFCHTSPARFDSLDADAGTNRLSLGRSEDDEQVPLGDLQQWWGKQRQSNPIVILNACSSGQQDLVYGAPFVDFFMKNWGAQAFIGTDWPVNASFADVFGRRLLGEILRNRRSLRDAFRAVSDEAAADDNFFPLMYAVYGLNTVQFTDPLSS